MIGTTVLNLETQSQAFPLVAGGPTLLTEHEIDAVSGGIIPVLVVGGAFLLGMAVGAGLAAFASSKYCTW